MSANDDARSTLLIGANGGVGAAAARKMLDRGYRVTATVSRPERQKSFTHQMPGCRRVIPLDLSDSAITERSVAEMVAEITAAEGRLDAVIVCAAVSPFAPAETTSLEMFRRTMEINCVSHLAIYRAAMPALRACRGRFVFTSSLSGRVATPMMGAYVASKFALEGLADVMRQEAGAWGVEVILLQPGTIDTPIVSRSRDALAAAIPALPAEERLLYGKLYRQMQYRVVSALDAGGLMPPEVVADAVIHAIETPQPLPRYRIGADAEFLIGASRTKSDREMDSLVLDIYGSSPVDGD
jgi:NAD(P)-dependent dehydrogenase (short-subunit alcohol dehydrogenase family)